jgi:16S rRNA (guanine(1405)-N(7))-methyltransferase
VSVDVDAICTALRSSRKYCHVAPAVLERIARDESRHARDVDDAVDHAKRRLHQVFAAFVSSRELDRAEKLVESLEPRRDAAARESDASRDGAGSRELVESCARRLLALHASTRERLATFETLYARVWSVTGAPSRLLDLGCGFHPFALPWMGLASGAHYHAVDLDGRLLELVGRYLRAVGREHTVDALDLVEIPPLPRADVAFAMKLLPTLERQRDGAASSLLSRLDARFVVLSFPTASLAHRQRGMRDNYDRFARDLVAKRGTIAAEFDLTGEIVKVVELDAPR